MTETDISRSATVLFTGPTRGIGRGMLRALVQHPARPHLVLLARDPRRLGEAVTTARAAGLTAHGIAADLADLATVRDAIAEVAELRRDGRIARLDAVILNAGAQFMNRRSTGAQGWERTFTVNVIAQHLLASGLAPQLAPGGHVVALGSSTHRGSAASFRLIPDPQWQHPAELARIDADASGSPAHERTRGGVAYASSKLALVTMAHVWADRLGAAGHRVNVYDPGLTVRTGLVRDLPAYRYWVWRYVMPILALHPKATTAAITGRHAIELALAHRHVGLHDGYVEIGKVTTAEPVTFDRHRQETLAEWLDAAVTPFLAAAAAGAAPTAAAAPHGREPAR